MRRYVRANLYADIGCMAKRSAETDAVWRAFKASFGVPHDDYAVVAFDDNPETATELADLVLAGRKRATASLLRDYYPVGGEPLPRVGDFVVLIDGGGTPRCIWRTTEVEIKPLSAVDNSFAWDEGEGDRSRQWWLEAHRRYFTRQAGREGFAMHDGIETVFERFEVVWPVVREDKRE